MILACNMMTLHAPFYLLGLPRNHHMHHLPSSDIIRSSQDQIKLGIKNTVVINKWPQGAWSLPTILAQHHEYTTTRYPRYHHDPCGDHNPTNTWPQPVILTVITTTTNIWLQTVILTAITTTTNFWPMILTAITTTTNIWPRTVILMAITTMTNIWSKLWSFRWSLPICTAHINHL